MKKLSIVINGEVHSSKNHTRIMRSRSGKPFVSKSIKAKEDEAVFAYQFYGQREKWEEMIKGVKYPLHITFLFRRRTRARFDYVNIAQGILDALVRAEYLTDDSMDFVIPSFLPYVLDKENPGCDIFIGGGA